MCSRKQELITVDYRTSKKGFYDIDIRRLINRQLFLTYLHDSSTKIINEFQLPFGNAIIDIAVVNEEFIGFEIKSDHDTLKRLPAQMYCYSKIFDKLSLVTTEKVVTKAISLLPEWWGIFIIEKTLSNEFLIKEIRPPQLNRETNLEIKLQLLWKEELIKLLELYNLPAKYKYKYKQEIRELLINSVPAEELKTLISFCIRRRYPLPLNFPSFLEQKFC